MESVFHRIGLLALVGDYSDSATDRIHRIIISTSAINNFAGMSVGYADGVGTVAKFDDPYGVVISSDGTFALVADRDNFVIRKIIMSTRLVTTV